MPLRPRNAAVVPSVVLIAYSLSANGDPSVGCALSEPQTSSLVAESQVMLSMFLTPRPASDSRASLACGRS